MKKYNLVSWIRLGLAILTASAVTTQLIYNIQSGKDIVNFFSFFTIESNILAAILLVILALSDPKKAKGKYDYFRGAVTLYMTMTGIVYMLLLSGNEISLMTTLPWVNIVLHYIMPVAILIDWLLVSPKKPIAYKKALYWLLFPIVYFSYSLIRGAYTDWYPYPFMNPILSGWTTVIVTATVIALGVLLLTKILTLKFTKK